MKLPLLSRRPLVALLSAGLLAVAAACSGDDLADAEPTGDDTTGSAAGGQVTIASQSFDEAALVTAMYGTLLEGQGYTVEKQLVDTRDIYMQEFPASVDIVPEYVAGIGDFLNTQANGEDAEPITSNDPESSLEGITPLAEAEGITLLEPSPATSQNAFFVTEEYASSNDASALSDLEGESVVLAAAPDCEGRDDCEKGLREVYGIDITKVLPLGFATPETYKSVLDGESQLGLTGTLDGTLDEQGLVLLEDDRGIQPAQNLIPAVSSDFLAEHPDVEETLNTLMAELDNETLGELIARVAVEREKPEAVASEYLQEQGLL